MRPCDGTKNQDAIGEPSCRHDYDGLPVPRDPSCHGFCQADEASEGPHCNEYIGLRCQVLLGCAHCGKPISDNTADSPVCSAECATAIQPKRPGTPGLLRPAQETIK
jgi:hypothetical protein